MKKRVLSLFLALVVTFSMICPLVFADDSSSHVHNWTSGVISEFSDTVEGIPVSVSVKKCTECNFYKHTYKFFGLSFDFYSVTAYTGIVEDFLLDVSLHIMNSLGKNASAKKYETGGGSAGTGGVGRRPSGYADDSGTPSVGPTGIYTITLDPIIEVVDNEHCTVTITGNKVRFENFDATYTASNELKPIRVYYVATAPGDGKFLPLYDLNQAFCSYSSSTGSYGTVRISQSNTKKYLASYHLTNGTDFSDGYTLIYPVGAAYVSQGSKVGFAYYISGVGLYPSFKGYGSASSAVYTFYPLKLSFTPTEVNKQTSITINQNTWNGNIYQDNSTNLTYIYPQYTTINENNETVTNISETPIIYNNETKQYYTYDTVTNNYYYITYEAPTPSPSPDPDPTPTPTPGGDTGDTSGIIKILQEIKAVLVSGFAGITEKLQNIGVGGSTPETAQPGSSSGNKGQSWWEKLLGKIGDAIVDGLLGAISAVLKLIFKLFTTILGWIIWLVSQVLTLFPFLPPGLGALLIGGVVVCFIIGLIKFIRG